MLNLRVVDILDYDHKKPKEEIAGYMVAQRFIVGTGLFHRWAEAYEEFEYGPGNYCVGLIELPDGTMLEVLPQLIRFKPQEIKPGKFQTVDHLISGNPNR